MKVTETKQYRLSQDNTVDVGWDAKDLKPHYLARINQCCQDLKDNPQTDTAKELARIAKEFSVYLQGEWGNF